MARTYKNAIKMRLEGKLHSNDMTMAEKVVWLIYLKAEMEKSADT